MGDVSKLTDAIDCAKSGEKARARQLLAEVIQAEPNNEVAWLWMSGVVGSKEQQVYCLQQVLRINPNSQPALAGLSRIAPPPTQPDEPVRPRAMETPPEPRRAAEPSDNGLPLPDVPKLSSGFTGWNILDTVLPSKGAPPELGVLIAESAVAKNRIFGWAGLFLFLAAVFAFLATLGFPNPWFVAGIALVFFMAALYRFATWYLAKDLKVEVFREGLRLRKDGKTSGLFWRDVDYVKERWHKSVYQGIVHIYTHKIEIQKTNGQKLELDRSFDKIEAIGRLIQLAAADHLLPATVEQLRNNAECDFGAFTLSRAGIKRKDKFLSWEKVKSLDVDTTGSTTVKIQSVDSKWSNWATENGGGVKNLQLFLSLAYWFIHAARRPASNAAAPQEEDHGDVLYPLPITKAEAATGIQKTLYIGTSLHEQQLVVKVPAGVQSGTTYRFPGYGRPGGNGAAGTLTVAIDVEKVTSLQKRLEEIQIGVGVILMLGLVWLGFWSSLDLLSNLILAALLGGVIGTLMAIRQRLLGAISGVIGGVICLIVQVLYFALMYIFFARESFWNYEIFIVFALSVLPGFGLFALLKKLTAEKPASD